MSITYETLGQFILKSVQFSSTLTAGPKSCGGQYTAGSGLSKFGGTGPQSPWWLHLLFLPFFLVLCNTLSLSYVVLLSYDL